MSDERKIITIGTPNRSPIVDLRTNNPVVHRRKLFGGRVTAEELHHKLAWGGAKCSACSAPPAIRIQIFVALSDMSLDTRTAVEIQLALGKLHAVMTDRGKVIRTSLMFACTGCQQAAERAAAKGPSYAIVDISRGPGPENALIAVPSSLKLV